MASGPITSWKIDGETMEIVADFYFSGLQNHCNCSHEIKRRLLLERTAMTNIENILFKNQRHYFANTDPYKPSCGFFL